jgi:Dit-like tail protein
VSIQAAVARAAPFIPTASMDVVGIYNQDYIQVFPGARPIKATVKPDSKLMEQPLETGATIVDHRIILPIEIELSMILRPSEYRDTIANIKQLWLNATLLIVQTRSGVYPNQVIQSLPHEEDPDYYDTLVVALKLKEVQFVTAKYEPVPRNPGNKSTVNRGTIDSNPSTPMEEDRGTILYKAFH